MERLPVLGEVMAEPPLNQGQVIDVNARGGGGGGGRAAS